MDAFQILSTPIMDLSTEICKDVHSQLPDKMIHLNIAIITKDTN